MANECVDERKNLSESNCNDLPELLKSMIETNNDFVLEPADYADEAALAEALQDAIKNGKATRIYKWPNFVTVEDISKEPAYEDTPLAYLAADDGQYRYRVSISKSLCMHKATFTHKRNTGRLILIDKKNRLFGTKDSSGNFKGFKIQLLNPENLKLSDGTVSTKSPIVIALEDPNEVNQNGALINASSVISNLVPLADVDITVVSATSSLIVVDVKATCDGTGIEGLVTADFQVTENDGDPQTVTATAVAGVSGRYNLAGTSLVDGFVDLDPPATLSIDAYESTGPAVVNVP